MGFNLEEPICKTAVNLADSHGVELSFMEYNDSEIRPFFLR